MKKTLIITATVCLTLVSAAQAESILGELSLRSTGIIQGRSVTITRNGSTLNTTAGTIGIRLDPTASITSGMGHSFVNYYGDSRIPVFCADVYQFTNSNYQPYAIYEPCDAPIGGQNSIFLPDGMSSQQANDLALLWGNYRNAVVDSDTAAAFQLSQWEIINETSGNYSLTDLTSLFYTTTSGGFVNLGDQWLASLSLLTVRAPLVILGSEDNQDFGILTPSTPEPMTALCVLIGFSGVGVYLKRRNA